MKELPKVKQINKNDLEKHFESMEITRKINLPIFKLLEVNRFAKNKEDYLSIVLSCLEEHNRIRHIESQTPYTIGMETLHRGFFNVTEIYVKELIEYREMIPYRSSSSHYGLTIMIDNNFDSIKSMPRIDFLMDNININIDVLSQYPKEVRNEIDRILRAYDHYSYTISQCVRNVLNILLNGIAYIAPKLLETIEIEVLDNKIKMYLDKDKTVYYMLTTESNAYGYIYTYPPKLGYSKFTMTSFTEFLAWIKILYETLEIYKIAEHKIKQLIIKNTTASKTDLINAISEYTEHRNDLFYDDSLKDIISRENWLIVLEDINKLYINLLNNIGIFKIVDKTNFTFSIMMNAIINVLKLDKYFKLK